MTSQNKKKDISKEINYINYLKKDTKLKKIPKYLTFI